MRFATIVLTFAVLAGCEAAPTPNNTGTKSAATPSPTATAASANTPPASANASAPPTLGLSPLPPDAAGVQAAIDVIHEYYNAINARDYKKAYELWSGNGEASKQTFEQFRDGFANTASVEIDTSGEPGDLEGAAGSQYVTIPLLIKAKTKDGKDQKFWGQYVLRRSMVDGATPEQRMWRIYSAEFKEL